VNKIEFGDCREIMKRWKEKGVKVQTVVTSPPYFGLRDYGHDGQIGLEETVGEYVANIVDVFANVWNILEDDGTVWLNLGDSYYNYRPGKGQALNKQTVSNTNQDLPTTCARRGNKQEGLKEKDLIGIPWRVAFALQEFGWYLRQDIIWHKPNPMPESVKDRCTKAHEYIFLLTKKPQYYFNNEAIKEPSVDPESYKGRKKRSAMTEQSENIMGDFGATRSGFKNISAGKTYEKRNKRDVWSITVRPYKGAHFATFPKELVELCILAGSKEGDIVFDPFMGSGTTAQVALDNARQYLGCELNLEYKKLQDERLNRLL
jgi:DNA modification methylase